MPATALQSLDAYQAGGWLFDEGSGFYVHQGSVYITGRISSQLGAPVVTEQILSGLPIEICPSQPIEFWLPIDFTNTDDTSDAALKLPIAYRTIIHTDGTWIFADTLPEQINVTPDAATYFYINYGIETMGQPLGQQPRYTQPLQLSVLLGGATWKLTTLPDDWVPQPLAPFLGTDYDDIDSNFVIHGSRVHLGGHVRSKTDNPGALLSSLPTSSDDGLPGVGGCGAALVKDGSTIFGLEVIRADAALLSADSNVVPSGDSPPLNIDLFGSLQGSRPAGFTNGHPMEPFLNPQYPHGAGTGTSIYDYGSGPLDYDNGVVECDVGMFRHFCDVAASVPSFTFNLPTVLALMFQPLPQWYVMTFTVGNGGGPGEHCTPIGCVANAGDNGSPVLVLGANVVDSLTGSGPPGTYDWAGNEIGQGSYVSVPLAPETPLYVGDPGSVIGGAGDINPLCMFRADQVEDLRLESLVLAAAAHDDSTGEPLGVTSISYFLSIYPAYEARAVGIHEGDIIDLTGAGWPGSVLDPPTAPPGTIAAGPFAGGSIRIADPLHPRGNVGF